MLYQKTWLTRRVRLTLMIILIALFFISAPLVIFYTSGYWYDVKNSRVEQTGVLSIDVLPADAIITLNGVEVKQSLPIRLPNLVPGTYHLVITRAGYRPWEKDMVVEAKSTTYITDIRLLLSALPVSAIDTADTRTTATSSGYVGRDNVWRPVYEEPSGNRRIDNQRAHGWFTWRGTDLWSIDAAGHATLLNRFSVPIQDVLPLDQHGQLLISFAASLVAYEPRYAHSQSIWENGSVERVAVNQPTRRIYFLGTVGKKYGWFELAY